jgi:hypothetical protein
MKTQNTTIRQVVSGTGLMTLALAGGALTQSVEAAMVTLNGQPLQTSVAPIQRNGRTLVPMRDIFQALGASVNWNGYTQSIAATRGETNVGLQMGRRAASINGRTVSLDQAPILYRGSTMVPLRFVSEAMGAKVNWNGAAEIAAITTSGQQVAGVRTITVPAGSVMKVSLGTDLSSATSRVGDPFVATVNSQAPGDSEFPAGSRIEGVVREAQAKSGSNPGVLDLDFRSVTLPDGTRYPLQASLISLDNASVDTSTAGRITAKKTSGKSGSDRLKVIGIGAGAGFLLGKLLKKNSTLTAVLGAAGGYLYSNKSSKGEVREAMVPTGTELGVRVDRNLAYADRNNYYAQRSTYIK